MDHTSGESEGNLSPAVPAKAGATELWRLVNSLDPMNAAAVRAACSVLLLAYTLVAITRHDPLQPAFDLVRGAICLWGVVGVVCASWFTGAFGRFYTVALAVLMSVGTGYIHAVQGNPAALLPVTALATFIPMIFLQAGRDVLLTSALIVAGHSIVLALFPPVHEPINTVALMIGGSMAAGAACGLIILAYRALLERSTQWWQDACGRERILRELAEVASSTSVESELLALLPERFRDVFDAGRCMIVLREEGDVADDPAMTVVATAGLSPEEDAEMRGRPVTPHAAEEILDLVRNGRPFVRGTLAEEEERDLRENSGVTLPTRSLVALPVTVEGLVAGAVILSDEAPRSLPAELIDLLQAMARQAGAGLAQARLFERLHRLVSDLNEARTRAEEASRAKSSFLANTSHEIRTPMNGVLGALDLLLGGDLPPEAREYAEIASRSAGSLLAILNDILDFSKIEAGRLVLESSDFGLAGVLEEAADIVAPIVRSKGLALAVRVDDGVPEAMCGDALRLRQVLVNLLSNATKFTKEGEISLGVEREASDGEDVVLRFTIRDTGIGIASDRLCGIFDSFSQADGSTTRRYGGTGLGLAICRQLVTLMHGKIGVESVVGTGSTFWFTVRLAVAVKPVSEEVKSEPRDDSAAGAGLTVLLAEDNPVNQLVAVRMLERLGCSVHLARTGREALLAARSRDYDLILMDQHMPDLDGVETALEIRRTEAGGRRTPIVALTASILEEDRVRCSAAGMDDFLTKPIDRSALRSVLQRTAQRTLGPAVGAAPGNQPRDRSRRAAS